MSNDVKYVLESTVPFAFKNCAAVPSDLTNEVAVAIPVTITPVPVVSSFLPPPVVPYNYLEDTTGGGNWSAFQIPNHFPKNTSTAAIGFPRITHPGLDPNKYGGHSLRSGFATSAAESGAEERNIMAMTGHKTTQMVRRYIQEANLFKNNALNKIKI